MSSCRRASGGDFNVVMIFNRLEEPLDVLKQKSLYCTSSMLPTHSEQRSLFCGEPNAMFSIVKPTLNSTLTPEKTDRRILLD